MEKSEPLEERVLIWRYCRRPTNFFSILRNVFRSCTFLLENVLLLAKRVLRRDIFWLNSLSDDVVEAQVSKKAMILNVLYSILEISISLRKIVVSEVTDKAFCSLVKLFGKAYLGLDYLLEDFKRIVVHKWTCSYKHFINENAQTIPVNWFSMPFIHNYFWSKILRSTTNGVSSLSLLDPLDKPEV